MYFNTHDCGDRISHLRKSRSMTQLQLAIKLNITDGNLCKIEKGLRSPSIDLLVDISELFHVSLDYLILGKTTQEKADQILNEADAALDHIRRIQQFLKP